MSARRVVSLGTLMLSLMLAACGGNNSSHSGVTNINFWGWNPSPNSTTFSDVIKAFNDSHPTIKVVYKWQQYDDYTSALKLAMASGTGPDVFGVQAGGFAKQYDQFMQDLTPYEQQANGANWKDNFVSVGLNQFVNGSRTQALPFENSAAGYIFYNKTVFDQYGLTAPKTFNDWVTVSQQLKSKGVTPFIQGAKDGWQDEDMFLAFANSIAPGKLYDAIAGKVSFTDPDLVQAMETWKSLFSNGIMQNGALATTAYPDAFNQWVSGKAAMILMGTWNDPFMTKDALATQQKQLNFTQNYEYLPILVPQVGAYPTRVFGGPDVGLAMNKASSSKDAAWQFIQYLLSKTGGQQWVAQTLNGFPTINGVTLPTGQFFTDAQQQALQQQATDLKNAVGYRAIPYPELDTALINALQNVASGQQTPQQAMQALQQTSQGIQR